jgi:hypothetical protein
MSETVSQAPAVLRPSNALFALAVFSSAALVFLVEPMIAQMLLPRLGGSPAVWNTSLAFFQIALLAGYAYAHLVQRLGQVRRQMGLHLALLAAAALVLPLHIAAAPGQSSTAHPILWLLGVLTLSIGAPFAVLSATAPLLQAWFARTATGEGTKNPYVLYAASNLGSLLALLAYPFVVQPLLGLRNQAVDWSLGYGAFALLIAALVILSWRAPTSAEPASDRPAEAAPAGLALWRERGTWVLLAAAPSSLLLGVTLHITTDVASAPFLWVPPLAIYLLTFVVAFQDPPPLSPGVILALQALIAPICLVLLPIKTSYWLPLLGVHLASFFVTALMCHQALAMRRPPPGRLTEFYLLMSLGGVIGGAFNAFLAPVIFNGVWEYPLVLVLAGLARPWTKGPFGWRNWTILGAGVVCALILARPDQAAPLPAFAMILLFGILVLAAFLLRSRAPAFVLATAALAVASQVALSRYGVSESWRSFFGVVQLGEFESQALGPIRFMVHGSTLHGAQAADPALRCTPMTYYAPADPIGQVFRSVQARSRAVSFGAVGLGAGSVAAYVRPADAMQFFEIDPLVVRIAGDPSRFSFWHGCAKGPVSVTLGDARLSLQQVPDARYDILLVDAFSSDSVPIHLMTVEAMRTYLRVLKPGGVVVMHLSNRNLELTAPAAAIVAAAGASALVQDYKVGPKTPTLAEAGSIVLIAARTPQDLASFARDPRWRPADARRTRPWTDDYSNVLGALIGRVRQPR